MEKIIFRVIKVLVLYLSSSTEYADSGTIPRPQTQRFISFSIPDIRPLEKSLGFIEDTYLNFTELTTKYGFPTEEHSLTTEDGYILKVFRILPKCNVTKGYPIMLMHGLTGTSDQWILTGPRTGLGYILANECYDVWAANHRGNEYTRKHIRLNPDEDPEFWEYTVDEHGNYDLPATIDFILKTTGKPKVNYIGHSQGTTDFIIMGSLRPEYNKKIQISFLLAPIVYLKHIKSLITIIASSNTRQLKAFADNFGLREILGKHQLIHAFIDFLCHFAPEEVCGTSMTLSFGYKRGNISPRNIAVAFAHLVAGLTTKEIAHLGQFVCTGKFQRYDEGRQGNLLRYGTPTPPDYDVTKVTSAVVLICSKNDWLSSLEDMKTLRSKLPNVVEYYEVPDPTWSHNDQMYGIDAPKYVFTKILELLNM